MMGLFGRVVKEVDTNIFLCSNAMMGSNYQQYLERAAKLRERVYRLLDTGETQAEVARIVGMSRQRVQQIVKVRPKETTK
jgi:hypothetical protein